MTLYPVPKIDPADLEAMRQELDAANQQGTSFDEQGEPDAEGKRSQADKIVQFVREKCDLFHDANRTPYACTRSTGEVLPMSGRAFRDWLAAAFFQETEKAIRDNSLREARMTLEGLAMQDARSVHVRVAGDAVTGYWLDLAQRDNNLAAHITPGGWCIKSAEVHFFRPENMLALPTPNRQGNISPLWEVVNIPEHYRLLVVAWLVDCLRPDTPYPLLELLGEQGSAKSSSQETIRKIIDPSACNLRGAPKSPEDVFISGASNHLVSCENVSHLAAPIQDAMCTVATGGGFAKRRLYSDSDETVIQAKRPIILNGISASVTQQDLVSRALTLELPRLADAKLKNSLDDLFERNYSGILGSLLNIAADALKHLPESSLPPEKRPRLIEFAYLGMATAKAMGQPPEAFMQQFEKAREDGLERTLDASPVAGAIREWAEVNRTLADYSAKQWLELLAGFKQNSETGWPKSPKGLGDAMRRAAPALRQLGIECTSLGKMGGSSKWRIGIIQGNHPI